MPPVLRSDAREGQNCLLHRVAAPIWLQQEATARWARGAFNLAGRQARAWAACWRSAPSERLLDADVRNRLEARLMRRIVDEDVDAAELGYEIGRASCRGKSVVFGGSQILNK